MNEDKRNSRIPGRNAPERSTSARAPIGRGGAGASLPGKLGKVGGPPRNLQDREARRIPRGTSPLPVTRSRLTPGAPSPSRRVALDVIVAVERERSYVQLALDRKLNSEKLIDADRRLVTELVYGTLENKLKLDWVIAQFMDRPTEDVVLKNALRMGAYQILYLDRVPDSAAVTESVNLVRMHNRAELTGLCNAVLRNLSRGRNTIVWPDESVPLPQRLSILHSVPVWLAEEIIAQYGSDEAEALLAYRPDERTTCVRPNLLRMDADAYAEHLTKSGIAFERGMVPFAFHIRGGASGTDFVKGTHSIQGESSMLAVLAIGVKNGWQVLDACAAPGGKTLLISELMHGTGRVYAWDTHPHRVELITASVRRLGLDNVRTRVQDSTYFRDDVADSMDAVLVDAPCSGFGVMLNKPDVKYRHTLKDVEALAERQAQLLETCSKYVKPGGVLVYSTCTILQQENQRVIRAFLEAHPEFHSSGLADKMPEALRGQVTELGLQTLPHRDAHMEGFFIARLVRDKAPR